MRNDPLTDEALRLSVLHRYRILDTPPEPEFDDLVRVAALVCDVPICLISFIDETRQWFKARLGFEAEEIPRSRGFCTHAISDPHDVLDIPDASADARFTGNPFVIGSPHIRFYAGAPLVTSDGYALGTLCVIDQVPHHLTSIQRDALQSLARQVMSLLELRLALASQRSQFERLAALRAIDLSIIMNVDVQAVLGLILDQMIFLLGVDAADALVRNHETNALEYAVRRGFRPGFIRPAPTAESEVPLELAVQHERLITVADLPDGGAALFKMLADAGEMFESYYAVPLISKGAVCGIIQLYLRMPITADQSWLEFLETLAGQASIAVDNANLFNQLERLNEELVVSHDATIEGWSRALDLRDRETEGHSQRVTAMTLRLATAMGIEGDALVQIRRGALLHDVGKLGIPDGILLKPGPLTDEEWEIMKKHPIYAYEMLYPLIFLQSALDIPYCHHEKWDGAGYPNGLEGEQIPLAARIFAVADVHDALRSDRPYRKGWPEEQVRQHIASLAGIHFDPRVVAAYLKLEPEERA